MVRISICTLGRIKSSYVDVSMSMSEVERL